jgi:hypothetical protein
LWYLNNLNAYWYSTGECMITDGGSYSDVCKVLNVEHNNPTIIANIPDICKPPRNSTMENGPLGYPSRNGQKIRYYTTEECNILGGFRYNTGECLSETTNFSTMCAALN